MELAGYAEDVFFEVFFGGLVFVGGEVVVEVDFSGGVNFDAVSKGGDNAPFFYFTADSGYE